MNRFFRCPAEQYEIIRASMDADSGFPSAHAITWFSPAAQALCDSESYCLIAAITEIANRFVAEHVEEITFEQYASAFPESIS